MRRVRVSAVDGWGGRVAIVILVLSSAILTAAAGVASTWRTEGVQVDGLANDGQTVALVERGVMAGAVNDDEFLYLVVSTREPASLVSLSTGLIVWIDPSGRRGQTFGVRVPGIESPTPGAAPAPPTPGSAPGLISTETFDHFDVLGPGKNQRRLVDLTSELGIALALSFSDAELTYEVKLPLAKTVARPYAVGGTPGRTIGLGIATPEMPRTASNRQPLVGSSGIIGGNPFFGGGFAPYRQPDGRPKPLEVWTTLTLASPAR
jgi:hypothetical protein